MFWGHRGYIRYRRGAVVRAGNALGIGRVFKQLRKMDPMMVVLHLTVPSAGD